jgi:hypothetical protein
MEWIGHAPQRRPKFSHPGLNNCLNWWREGVPHPELRLYQKMP